jgi:hypothetical protein
LEAEGKAMYKHLTFSNFVFEKDSHLIGIIFVFRSLAMIK